MGPLAALLVTLGLDKDWRLSWMVGAPWLAPPAEAYFTGKAAARRSASAENRRPRSLKVGNPDFARR